MSDTYNPARVTVHPEQGYYPVSTPPDWLTTTPPQEVPEAEPPHQWLTTEAPQPDQRPEPNVPPGGGAAMGAATGLTFGLAPAISGVRAAGRSTLPQEVQDVIEKHGSEPVLGELVAGLGRLGYEHLIAPALKGAFGVETDPYATRAYTAGREQFERERKAAEEQRPIEYIGGQMAGTVATLPVTPGARAITAAPTALGRIGVSARTGAITGGAQRAGESFSRGEPMGQVAEEAGKGVAEGTLFGTVGGATGEGIGRVAQRAASVIRGWRNPDEQAIRNVVEPLVNDFRNRGIALTRDEYELAQRVGIPVTVADLGGPQTKALARVVFNLSPDAAQTLTETVTPRFRGQSERVANFVRGMFGGRTAGMTMDDIQQAARNANRPAYQRAYAAGDRPIMSDELRRLGAADAVQDAAKAAVSKWRNRQIADGFGALRSPIELVDRGSKTGSIVFRNANGVQVEPNIQFWDYTVRHLADAARKARRDGLSDEASMLGNLERQLKAELDSLVPEFGEARRGAAGFFGAENALDAGREFVASNANMHESARALGRMTDQERELFAHGFASELTEQITKSRDTQNLLNQILSSDNARQQVYMALGPERARQLEVMLRVEDAVDRLRQAMGNSTTAQQTSNIIRHLSHGAGHGLGGAGALGALEYMREGEINPKHLLTVAFLYGAAKGGMRHIDERVAARTAELLVSRDQAALERGIRLVSQNPTMLNALRQGLSVTGRTATSQIPAESAFGGLGAVLQNIMETAPSEHHGTDQRQDVLSDYIPQK